MQNNRFVALTGHLSNYSLSDLVGILRHQRKSGRLLIEYPKGPATLFFENGELIDVRLNELTGLQAICVLLAQPEASFNFNPLIRSSQRSIDSSFQRVVSELFGCWDETSIQLESQPLVQRSELNPEPPPQNAVKAIQGTHIERLALPPARSPGLRQRSIYVIAAVLIIIGISTGIAVTATLKQSESQSPTDERSRIIPQGETQSSNHSKSADASSRVGEATRNRQISSAEQRRQNRLPNKRSEGVSDQTEGKPAASQRAKSTESAKELGDSGSSSEPIKVVMQIENGRVLKASVANHAPGMDSFEALALRIARQRRYPAAKTGAETVTVSVNKPDK